MERSVEKIKTERERETERQTEREKQPLHFLNSFFPKKIPVIYNSQAGDLWR